MAIKKSHGRRDGNRNSAETCDNDHPNRNNANIDVDSRSANRNEDWAGGRKFGNC